MLLLLLKVLLAVHVAHARRHVKHLTWIYHLVLIISIHLLKLQ